MKILLNIALFSLILIVLAVVMVLLILGNSVFDGVGPGTPGLNVSENKTEEKSGGPSSDLDKYYDLKNLSCQTLSGNFLTVVRDTSTVNITGLDPKVPEDVFAASLIADKLEYNMTEKTYVREDWVKLVDIDSEGHENLTIWKAGRIYRCDNGCTMNLIENEPEYGRFSGSGEDCRYFGKTPLPKGVDRDDLFDINYRGKRTTPSSICENFEINVNQSYAEGILEKNLTERQESFFWALTKVDSPVIECLDEGTGITAHRSLVFDLTDSYLLDFDENGGILIYQKTELMHYQDEVPKSFFNLPE